MLFTDKLKKYALRAIWVLVCLAVVWGNFKFLDYKNKKIDELNTSVTELKAKNEQLSKTIEDKGKSDDVTTTVVADTKEQEVKIVTGKTVAAKYVDNKLAEIEAKYALREQTTENAQRKALEVSLERAKGMWLTYCLQEPEEKPCK